MYCYRCGKPNPKENRYCGMCGARLPEIPAQDAEPVPAEPPPPPLAAVPPPASVQELGWEPEARAQAQPEPDPARRREPGIGGPSFLGLGGSDLMDEIEAEEEAEARSRRRRRGVAALVVLVVVLLLAFQWSRSGPGQGQLNELRALLAQQWERSRQPSQEAVAPEPSEPGAPDGEAVAGDEGAAIAEDDARQADPPGGVSEPGAAPDRQKADQGQEGAARPEITDEVTDEGMGDFVPPPAGEDEATPPKTEPAQQPTPPRAGASHPGDDLMRRADILLAGAGDRQGCEQGVRLLREAAQQGNARAHVKLGAMHATGNCVKMDRVAAYRWLTLAQRSDPRNSYIAHNKQMLLRSMDEGERRRAGEIDRMPF